MEETVLGLEASSAFGLASGMVAPAELVVPVALAWELAAKQEHWHVFDAFLVQMSSMPGGKASDFLRQPLGNMDSCRLMISTFESTSVPAHWIQTSQRVAASVHLCTGSLETPSL